jgi:hypothetical protein
MCAATDYAADTIGASFNSSHMRDGSRFGTVLHTAGAVHSSGRHGEFEPIICVANICTQRWRSLAVRQFSIVYHHKHPVNFHRPFVQL